MARQLYQSITSRDIDDQRILESDWNSGKPSGTQPRMVVLDVTFKNQTAGFFDVIKESCSLIRQEIPLATPNQRS